MVETRTTIRLQRLVSSGDLSSVFVARRNNDDDAVVVKCYNRDIVRTSQERLQRVLRERHALEMAALLPHPFVVGFRFAHVDPTFVYLGMENVGGGDLFSLMHTRGPFAPAQVRLYAAELCLALGHLHSIDMVHRDVKV